MKCSLCETIEEDINQNIFKVHGVLDLDVVDEFEVELDEMDIENGDIIYYYFDEKDEEIIKGSQNVAGRARALCRNCILSTIERTFHDGDPHYCDGVYFTVHNNFLNANLRVKKCHGDYVADRRLRAKFRVNNVESLLKISKTGGVLKTNEGVTNYDVNSLIFANRTNKNIVTYLGVEEYFNGNWIIRG